MHQHNKCIILSSLSCRLGADGICMKKNHYGSSIARGTGRWENANFHQLGADHGMAGTWTWETMALLVSGETPETPYECA